jgi:hypothetical protein
MQPQEAIVFSGLQRLVSSCGTMLQVTQSSNTERLSRKKYMGVWSLGSTMVRRMVELLSIKVTMWETRTTPNRGLSSHRYSEKLNKTNVLRKHTYSSAIASALYMSAKKETLRTKTTFSFQ